jgi:hypothetical protein
MAGFAGKTGAWFLRRTPGKRAVPIGWALLAAELVLATRRHWGQVNPRSRERLRELVVKSKGRPQNLTREERRELARLVGDLDLRTLSRELAKVASPIGFPGRRRRRGTH